MGEDLTSEIIAELRAMRADIERLADRPAPQPDIILTRDEAARQLKVSVRQLQRLIRAGRLLAHPSGIARAELERYAKTPQTRLSNAAPKRMAVAERRQRLDEMLKLRRRRRVT